MTSQRINPKSAYFIKLGRGGEYEEPCLTKGELWVGWTEVSHDLCIKPDWNAVWEIELNDYKNNNPIATKAVCQGYATYQKNQLRIFYESDETVLWVTFYADHLYWCFAKPGVKIQPNYSRVRQSVNGWSCEDIQGNKLAFSRLAGSLLAMQGFRGAICRVKEIDYLVRKINCETSLEEQKAQDSRQALIASLEELIKKLNWKEFELLIDLIFRQAGWQRVDQLGKTQKDIDLTLLSPIDDEQYYVQVKSASDADNFNKFQERAKAEQEYARYLFYRTFPEKLSDQGT